MNILQKVIFVKRSTFLLGSPNINILVSQKFDRIKFYCILEQVNHSYVYYSTKSQLLSRSVRSASLLGGVSEHKDDFSASEQSVVILLSE
jgi:hypothetical protein